MKILYIAQKYYPMNASSITTSEIVEKLAKRGHETIVLAPRMCSKKCIPDCSIRCSKINGVNVERVSTFIPYYVIGESRGMRLLTSTVFHLFIVLRAIWIIKEKKIDLIVSQHHPSHLASFSALILSRTFKLPLIVKTHDVLNSSSSLPEYLYLRILDGIHRIVFKYATVLLVVSEPLKSEMVRSYKAEENKIKVFSNGVDVKKFRADIDCSNLRHALGAESKKIILFIGRIRKERGLQLLLKAFPMIIRGNPNAMGIIVGDGPEKSTMRELVEILRIEKFVKFVQSVDHNEIPYYICASDITIGPLVKTVDTFGSLPRKVLEYMACAKPTVVRRGGVSKNLIKDKFNGFVIHSEDAKELASVISKVINSPDLAREVGQNARRSVEDLYNWDRLIDGFEVVLQEALVKNIE